MKYIIIDPTQGVFLGTARNYDEDMEEEDFNEKGPMRILALFSNHNVFDITKAVSFATKTEAQDYLRAYIRKGSPNAFVAPIETASNFEEFVDVVDIIKSGYGEYAKEMIDAMPMQSNQIH